MTDYTALKTKWATLTGTTAEKLAAVNAATVPGPNTDVSASAVIGYLALAGKLAGLQAYAAAPPVGSNATATLAAKELMALFSFPAFTGFFTSKPSVYSGVQGFLNALAADANSGITTTDATALLALAATTILWWRSAGYPDVIQAGDLALAGLS